MTYDEIVKFTNDFIIYKILFNPFFRNKFRSQSYAKWAIFEILEMVHEKNENDVFKIIDMFVNMMDHFLSIKFNCAFNVARRTAVLFKKYLLENIGGCYEYLRLS